MKAYVNKVVVDACVPLCCGQRVRTAIGGLLMVAGWLGHASVVASQPSVAAEPAAPTNLQTLLAGFQELEGLEAHYEEERHISLLSEPVESTGTLLFLPPSSLLKRVTTPVPSDILIHPGRIRIARGDDVETIDLEQRPEAAPLVEGILWLFAGDRAAVEGAFRTQFEVGSEGWTLQLVPRSEPLSQLISSMEVGGVGFRVRVIEVHETSGDRTVTRITSADPDRRFTDAEREELFEP